MLLLLLLLLLLLMMMMMMMMMMMNSYCPTTNEQPQTVMVLGQVGAEVEQEVDNLRCAQFKRSDNDWTPDKLGVTIVRVTDQVTLISRVYLLTCPITHLTKSSTHLYT